MKTMTRHTFVSALHALSVLSVWLFSYSSLVESPLVSLIQAINMSIQTMKYESISNRNLAHFLPYKLT